MKPKRWNLILVIPGGLLLAVAMLHFVGSNEAAYQGKTISVWFKEYAYSSNAPPPGLYSFPYSANAREVRWVGGVSNIAPGVIPPGAPRNQTTPWPGDPSVDALQTLGSNAVPYLVRRLQFGRLDRAYTIAFTNLPALIQRKLPNPGEKQWYRIRALDALGDLGDSAKGATPELLELLRLGEPGLRSRVLTTLRRVYAEGFAISGLLLQLGAEKRYAEVLQVATETKWQGREVAQLFGEILRSSDSTLHLDAIRLLEAAGERATPALDAVLGALGSQDREVRYLAARTVENISRQTSPEARAKIETALRPCLNDGHEIVRNVAARTLATFASPNSPSRTAHSEPTALNPMHDGKTVEEWFQAYVAGAGERMPANADGAMNGEFIRRLPDSGKPDSAWLAIQAIGSNAVACLVRHVSGDAKERAQAIELMYRLGPAAQAAAPVLLALLQQAEIPEAEEVCAAVRRIHAEQSEINEFLLTLAKRDRNEEVLRHARSLGWSGPDVARLLGELSQSSDPETCRSAITLLEAAGQGARPAVHQIVEVLKNPDPEIRYLAARSLSQLATNTPVALKALQALADDRNDLVRNVARRTMPRNEGNTISPSVGN